MAWVNTLYQGDVLKTPWPIPDGVIQCCVTSPPYWGLRTYGVEGQLGLEETPEEYIENMVKVFREVWRVGRPDMTVFLNMGDSYAGHWGQRYAHKPFGEDRTADGSTPPCKSTLRWVWGGLKPKDLCGIPWRLALALQADGWWLRMDNIWNKLNPMPESCKDRPTKSHEYVFLLTKSGTSKYWTHREKDGVRSRPKADYRWVNQITGQEVAEAPPDWKEIITCPNCEGRGVAQIDIGYEVMGQWYECWQEDECPVCKSKKKVQRWKRVNLWRGHDYFYDSEAVKERSTERSSGNIQRKYRSEYGGNPNHPGHQGFGVPYQPDGTGRNLRSVWTFATKPYPKAHFATFPPELPRRCILAGTSERGACPECGAPWERVINKKEPPKRAVESRTPNGQAKQGAFSKHRIDDPIQVQTLGWRPTCSCGHKETVPCAVIDPFIGAGTTAEVAIDLGRDFFGMDLNGDYLRDFAQPRVNQALKRQKARQAQGVLDLNAEGK